jgi:hypothetical protein
MNNMQKITDEELTKIRYEIIKKMLENDQKLRKMIKTLAITSL